MPSGKMVRITTALRLSVNNFVARAPIYASLVSTGSFLPDLFISENKLVPLASPRRKEGP